MRTETWLVNPDIAKNWLTKNKRNRGLNKGRVDSYAQEIQAGNWYLHHQGLAFYEDGSLADGQHRLAAIIQADVPVEMLVSWGVPEESGLMIDSHQQRQTHQSIKISGLADWIGKDDVSIARMMMCIQEKAAIKKSTPTQVVNFCESHKQSIEFAKSSMLGHRKYITTSMVRASVACAWYYEDRERLLDFCNVMETGLADGEADRAAIMAREWLLIEQGANTGASKRLDSVKRIMRAIKAFCEHQPIKKLYQPADLIYTPPISEEGAG